MKINDLVKAQAEALNLETLKELLTSIPAKDAMRVTINNKYKYAWQEFSLRPEEQKLVADALEAVIKGRIVESKHILRQIGVEL